MGWEEVIRNDEMVTQTSWEGVKREGWNTFERRRSMYSCVGLRWLVVQ